MTQGQFGEFVAAGGYADERWWGHAAAAGVWDDGVLSVIEWVGGEWKKVEREGPQAVGRPFSLDDHPAVALCWYEALAFCRWLDDRWRKEGLLPEGWGVGLPSEAEWEKAARGGLEVVQSRPEPLGRPPTELPAVPNERVERIWPFGDDFDEALANTEELEIRTTSAVGCFHRGASPVGCEEMAGNAWEWTRSVWGREVGKLDHGYPYDPEDGRENLDAEPARLRVLRGGSFAYDSRRARCSYRFRNPPQNRYHNIGFRLVVSPFFSDL